MFCIPRSPSDFIPSSSLKCISASLNEIISVSWHCLPKVSIKGPMTCYPWQVWRDKKIGLLWHWQVGVSTSMSDVCYSPLGGLGGRSTRHTSRWTCPLMMSQQTDFRNGLYGERGEPSSAGSCLCPCLDQGEQTIGTKGSLKRRTSKIFIQL